MYICPGKEAKPGTLLLGRRLSLVHCPGKEAKPGTFVLGRRL